MKLTIELLNVTNSSDIYDFEVKNRAYFEKHNLERITAGASTGNIASQKVLVKNGFTLSRKVENHIDLNGKRVDSFIYTISLPLRPFSRSSHVPRPPV